MKSRRVFLTIELDSTSSIQTLKDSIRNGWFPAGKIHQIQVNVAKPAPKGKAKK